MIKDLKLGMEVSQCKDCSKYKIGTLIYEHFEAGSCRTGMFLHYKDGTLYVNEQVLMSLIRIANPLQQDRKIQIVSNSEFKEMRFGK